MYGRLPEILRASKDIRCDMWLCRPLGLNSWSFCALGTVAHDMGVSPAKIFLGLYKRKDMREHCHISESSRTKCVSCTKCGARIPMMSLPAHNNDTHHLSYKDNADELEKAEIYVETTRQQKYIDISKSFIGPEMPVTQRYVEKIIKILVKD